MEKEKILNILHYYYETATLKEVEEQVGKFGMFREIKELNQSQNIYMVHNN